MLLLWQFSEQKVEKIFLFRQGNNELTNDLTLTDFLTQCNSLTRESGH